MHDVEVAAPGAEMAAGAQRERQRFRKAAGPHRADFERVDPVAVLVTLRRPEGIRVAVQVEAGQFGEGETVEPLALVEHGVGLGADDLYLVAEAGQLAREVPYVDALAAAERVPFIGEERDAQRSVGVGGRARVEACLHGLMGHSRPPSSSTFPRDYFGTVI